MHVRFRRLFSFLIFLLFFYSYSTGEGGFFSEEVKNYRKRGFIAYKEGNLDKAYQYFKKAVLLEPENPILHNDLGIIYERRGLIELAIKEYLEAIKLNRQYPAPYMNLALLYHDLGERESALFYLKERIRLGKENKRDPWYRKALAMLKEYEKTSLVYYKEKGEEIAKESKEKIEKKIEQHKEGTKVTEKSEVDEVEKLYQEGIKALKEGNFSIVVEKINHLLNLSPIYKATEGHLAKKEKERFIQDTREEEPILLQFP